MASTSHLVSLNQFLSTTTAIAGPSRVSTSRSSYIPSARGVVGFVVGKPLWWALSNLGITGGGGGEEDDEDDFKEWKKARGKWVVWENVEVSKYTQRSPKWCEEWCLTTSLRLDTHS
jgi:hypothetical protein